VERYIPGVRNTSAILRTGLIAALALLAACSTPPGIRVTGVDVVEVGESTSEVAVRLEIQNPTAEPIRLDTWDYSLSVKGRQVYAGTWVAAITVPAESRILTAIPAVVPNASNPGPDAAWRVNGWIRYLEPTRFSQMLYDLGLNRPSAGFGGDGPTMGKGGSVPSA
jgi:hypothetical protein